VSVNTTLMADETITQRVERLVLEYAQNPPPGGRLGPELSLRCDLAVESLSLVSLTIRLGDELGVDIVEREIDVGNVQTVGDLVALGASLSSAGTVTHNTGAIGA
jgi:acyl carrier protein